MPVYTCLCWICKIREFPFCCPVWAICIIPLAYPSAINCDWIWGNPPYGFFSENRIWCMVDKPYRRANSRSSPRPIARFAEELQRFVCDRITPPIIEKLQFEGVAMHAYNVSVYDAYTGSQLNGHGRSHPKWTRARIVIISLSKGFGTLQV